MESTERDGLRLLAPLRDSEAPAPSTVDVGRAVRAGARRVRVRQAMTAAVAAVVTGLAVVAVPAIVNRPQVVEPARPAAELSVLRQQFTVGSAGGFTPASYETGRYRHRVVLGPAHPDGSGWASVSMYARGHLPGWNPGGERAADVNGRKAFWMPAPATERATGTEIAWEWSDGAWGFAFVNSVAGDARDVAHRVAESVAGGADVPVAVPFTVPAPAGPVRLLGVITPFGTSSDPTSAAFLVLGTKSDADRVLVGVQRDLSRDPVTGQPHQAPAPTTQVAGHQAAVGDTSVTIFDVDGGFAVVATADQLGSPLVDLAGSVRLVPNPTDPGSWITNPLR
jgi:hypothetical protein